MCSSKFENVDGDPDNCCLAESPPYKHPTPKEVDATHSSKATADF
jgi:hypothetical protein